MDFKLTSKCQFSHRDNDGCRRNYRSFFLNDILILKQKIPFDSTCQAGFDRNTYLEDVYLLNGKIFQIRINGSTKETRQVYFPASHKVMKEMNVPKDLIIKLNK